MSYTNLGSIVVAKNKEIKDILKTSTDGFIALVVENSEEGKIRSSGNSKVSGRISSIVESMIHNVFAKIEEGIAEAIGINFVDDMDYASVINSLEEDYEHYQNAISQDALRILGSAIHTGRKVKDITTTVNSMFYGNIKALNIQNALQLISSHLLWKAYNNSLLVKLSIDGCSRVNCEFTGISVQDGIYDIRYIPDTYELGSNVVITPVEDDDVVYVDNMAVKMYTEEDIAKKQKMLSGKSIDEIKAEDYESIILEELDFMESVNNYFHNQTSTSEFSKKVELIVASVYQAEKLEQNAPLDLVNDTFVFEVKATTEKETTEQERGHIATGELARKYQYATDLALKGRTEGHHKYVLGVLGKDDTLSIYEQNYFSNKNSSMMLFVCKVDNFSSISWEYISTRNTPITVKSAQLDINIPSSIRKRMNDPFYWDVQLASMINIKEGDKVIRRGVEVGYVENSFSDNDVVSPSTGKFYTTVSLQVLMQASVSQNFDITTNRLLSSRYDGGLGIPIVFTELYKLGRVQRLSDDKFLCKKDIKVVPLNYLYEVYLTVEEATKLSGLLVLKETKESIGKRTKYIVQERSTLDKVNICDKDSNILETLSYNEFNSKGYRLVKPGIKQDLGSRITEDLFLSNLKSYEMSNRVALFVQLGNILTNK